MAALLGIGASQIRTKARDGILIRSGRGRYDVRASLARYLAQLRDAASRGGRQGQEEANRDLKAESIRVKRAQADAQELKNAASRGELLEATAVERQWASILRDVRAGLLAVPSRVGAKLPHLTAHDLAEIDREIRRSLERLSDGN
ncbi:terminase small subunit [Rhodovulum steppense]|uniref:Phage terminase Nu1 subunit (DNA packaging protein) n=1 Tax=Rhodovulum steppense TaxID=540251 RepID=A0A4R1YVL0_9RHOB|nr:terminase small subunit [Rhodovulum steppense]TCM85178.1 phage terminase Nu1 subunit (DNA packaging protein) [Rhodovulum steppense]